MGIVLVGIGGCLAVSFSFLFRFVPMYMYTQISVRHPLRDAMRMHSHTQP